MCIPAWRSADFIDRTLACARNQTLSDLRIVVSIDQCDDGTEECCRAQARADPRIEVHAQRERLGWAQNTNVLLGLVDTEFAFLFFHDDLIEPTYCERLVGALRARPDAATAHCDVGHFGASERVASSRSYDGSPFDRLLTYLVAPDKGSLLRSMFRTELVGHMRLPTGSSAGVWANQPFVMGLVVAGPVVGVAETLYRRWDFRPGGLTDGWRGLPFDEIVAGYRANAEAALGIIDGLDPSPSERDCLMLGLFVFLMFELRRAEEQLDVSEVHPPAVLLPAFADLALPEAVIALAEPLRTWCEAGYDRIQRRTGRRALDGRDFQQAVRAFEVLTSRHPAEARYWVRLAKALRGVGRADAAGAARRRVDALRRAPATDLTRP